MRFFVWVDFQYEMIALFLGAISLIMVYLAWASLPEKTHSQNRAGTRGKKVPRTRERTSSGKKPDSSFSHLHLSAYSRMVFLLFDLRLGQRQQVLDRSITEMPTEEELSWVKTWSIIGAIAAGFLAWGLLIYFVIGDKGPPGLGFQRYSRYPG